MFSQLLYYRYLFQRSFISVRICVLAVIITCDTFMSMIDNGVDFVSSELFNDLISSYLAASTRKMQKISWEVGLTKLNAGLLGKMNNKRPLIIFKTFFFIKGLPKSMSSPIKQQGIYTTKMATATSNFNAPSSKSYHWCFISYSV